MDSVQNQGTQPNVPLSSDNIGSSSSFRQIKMKNLGKKLLGNKKAGKLFRLGLQQITANQPDYFLVISKKFIGQGQYSKAFNLLLKQINKSTIELEYKPIIMHHFMHTCYKLMNKLIKNKAKEQLEVKDQQDPFSALPHAQNAKKKSTLTRIQKLKEIMDLQFQNLNQYEEILCEIVANYEQQIQENNKKTQKFEMQNRTSFNSNFESMQTGSVSDLNSSVVKGSNSSENNEDNEQNKKDDPKKKLFDVYKIEVFKENYLQYFLKTIILAYKHYKQEDQSKIALSFIEKGYDFIIYFVDSLFGDFVNYQIYRLSGDIIQIKANIQYEQQNISEALRLYDKAFNYYRISGQILLKKIHSKPQEDVDSIQELKCESIFSSLSINIMMQSFCYEQQSKYERMIEALQVSNWINLKLLVYEFSEKLRNHVADLLQEAKSKYSLFLEEKGEIRRVLLQAFPDMVILEKKQCENDIQDQMMNHIDNYLYDKGNIKEINQSLFIIQKKDHLYSNKSVQQDAFKNDHMISQDNFDQVTPQLYGQDLFGSGNNISQRNFSSNITVSSPERAKEFGSQSFTDFYNLNNNNNSTQLSNANQTTTLGNFSSTHTQFSFQNGYQKQTPSGNHSGNHLSYNSPSGYTNFAGCNSPSGISNNQLLNVGTAHNYNQNQKVSHSLHQINEKELGDYGISAKRPSNLCNSPGDTPHQNQSNRHSSQSQNTRSDKQNITASGFNHKRYSHGNLVIRSNRPTHEQPAPIYMKVHSDSFKPKMLTTNKYFQPETYKSTTSKTMTDFRDIANSCQEQEKKFHYLNLQPIRQKNERNQGVLSLDYAMENLIKEKIIQSEIKSIQNSLRNPPKNVVSNGQTGVNNSPYSSKMSNSQPALFIGTRLSTREAQSKIPIYQDIQKTSLQNHNNQNYSTEQNPNLESAIQKDIFCDKTIGVQIRNLMESLNISSDDQRVIIDDLSAKFEAEKRSLFSSSKTNKSKVSQQGWTTDKILQELLKSINILGENVNTYNQRFSQFLSTIKDEDFDRSEFHTCLKKLQFRQRMGNGNIPQFFQEKQLPLARIQERRKIDDEYAVVQGGGERMLEIMSDHKIIKNLFLEDANNNNNNNSNDPSQNKTNQYYKDNQQPKEGILVNSLQEISVKTGNKKEVHYSTAISKLQNDKRSSSTFENKNSEEQQSDQHHKPTYKQKKKKLTPGKTNTLQDIPLFQSSNSNVEKFNTLGNSNQGKKVNYFQKSQESLRQMVLKSEQDYEEMQKIIMNPKKNQQNHSNQTNLTFANFTNKLAFSTSKYNQKEKIRKSGSKMDLIDFMRIQNKWRQKAQEKNGTIISIGTSEGGENSPISTLSTKFKKASRNFILANAMQNQSSIFSRSNNQQQTQE